MKVLITGTSGFIGGALLRRCREAGWDVIGLGRRPLLEPGYQVRDLATPLPPAPPSRLQARRRRACCRKIISVGYKTRICRAERQSYGECLHVL